MEFETVVPGQRLPTKAFFVSFKHTQTCIGIFAFQYVYREAKPPLPALFSPSGHLRGRVTTVDAGHERRIWVVYHPVGISEALIRFGQLKWQ
jgi:hypothetical protein